MSDPKLSLDDRSRQRASALESANRKRREMAVVRRLLREGTIDPYAMIRGELDDVEPFIAKWTVEQVLRACPGIGSVRAFEVLGVFRASPRVKLRALRPERRQQLAELARQAVELV